MAVKPGDILQGRYRLDALIGRGGMGQVFSATDLEDRSECAVKVVSRLLVDDTMMVRLHREAEAAARIRSDYVPRVLHVSDTTDRELFLVMERLHGDTLSHVIRERGALPWDEVRHIGEDVLRGLIDAHTAGIVHRDLKPSNVFLSEKNGRLRAFILDFGVCKMHGVDHERLTGTGESIGTVAYMAPEQIRGAAKVDDRADLYAFGALVFEMLTGRLPHEGPSQMAILASKLEKGAARLADHVLVEIPEGLDALVAKALARDPQDRHSSAQDLLKDWRVVATGQLAPPSSTAGSIPDDASSRTIHDQPTRVARPNALGPTMVESPDSLPRQPAIFDMPTTARMPSRAPTPMPFEPYPTQNALTTAHGPAGERQKRSTRLALGLAAVGMLAGLVVIGVAVSRGASTSPATEAASPSAAPAPSAEPAVDPAPVPADPTSTSVTIDLGSEGDPAPVASAAPPPPRDARKPPVNRVRQPPRKNPPAAATSGQHITTQPRY